MTSATYVPITLSLLYILLEYVQRIKNFCLKTLQINGFIKTHDVPHQLRLYEKTGR